MTDTPPIAPATAARGGTMLAVVRDRYGSADVLQLRELARPSIGRDEVLVRVRAASLDRGAWHMMHGRPYVVRPVFGLRRPRVPTLGTDLVGVVVQVGSDVTGLSEGDEVFGTGRGTFAEYAVAAPDRLARSPEGLPAEHLAAVPVSGETALQALRDRGGLQAGQRVLVIGASGGVGTFTVQIAKAMGAEVTAVCSAAKLELVRSLGADHVIDYGHEELPADRRFDLVVDIAGNRSLALLRRSLAPRGCLVIVGGEDAGDWFGGLGRPLRASVLSLVVGQRMGTFVAKERREDLEVLAGMMVDGTIAPVIDRVCSLAELPDAMRDLEAGRVRGKVVVRV